MATITIDEKPYQFEGIVTILEAARRLGIQIPTLCHNDHLAPHGGCRICMVEAATAAAPGTRRLVPACTSRADDGMTVVTDSERVVAARRFNIALFLSRCPNSEKIRAVARELGVEAGSPELDTVSRYLLERAPHREDTNCILCGLCVRVCQQVPRRFALSFKGRGITRRVTSPFEKIAESCVGCGSCAHVCPTKAITVEEAG